MLLKTIKRFWWVLGILAAVVWAAIRGRNPWRGRAERAHDAATQAHHETIDAEGELAKEKVKHEAEKAADAVADKSVADLYNDAIDKLEPNGDGGHG